MINKLFKRKLPNTDKNILAGERRKKYWDCPQLKVDGGNVYGWTNSLGNYYYLPISKSPE